jgi:hypothetical protein
MNVYDYLIIRCDLNTGMCQEYTFPMSKTKLSSDVASKKKDHYAIELKFNLKP